MLRCALQEFQDENWESLLPYMEMYYNNTPSSSTEKTPFEIVYGKQFLVPGTLSSMRLEEDEDILMPPVEKHL